MIHKEIRILKATLGLGMIALFAATVLGEGNAQNGKTLFERRCAGCHSVDADHEGPRLKSVVGRQAGSVKRFQYSKSLEGAKFKWDEISLDKWLTDPESVVRDNDMAFRVPKPEERAAIIAYLKSL